MKETIAGYLVAIAILLVLRGAVTLFMRRVYARAFESDRVPTNWYAASGWRGRIVKGMRSSVAGEWVPNFKKYLVAFLIIDLAVAVILFLV